MFNDNVHSSLRRNKPLASHQVAYKVVNCLEILKTCFPKISQTLFPVFKTHNRKEDIVK